MALQEQGGEGWVPEDTFGTRLILLRHELGLTQEEAAQRTGLNPKTWNTWEHGSSPRHMDKVVTKIVEGLRHADGRRVNRDWLMWGNDGNHRYEEQPELPLFADQTVAA